MLLINDCQRINIGKSKHDRKDYSDTPLWTAIIYSVFTTLSLTCMVIARKQRNKHQFNRFERIAADDITPIYVKL